MRFYKLLNEDGTLNRIGTGEDGEEITEAEYNELLAEIKERAEQNAENEIDEEFIEDEPIEEEGVE